MSRNKTMFIAIAVVALFAALALVGCGSSSSSAASSASASGSSASASSAAASASASASSASAPTLESYIADHQDEWDKVVKELEAAGEGIMDVKISVTGNKVVQTMTYKDTIPADQIADVKAELEKQIEALKPNVVGQLKSMEQSLGATDLSWAFVYQNGDGTTIYDFEITTE